MNVLTIVLLLFVLFETLLGAKRGFFKSIYSFVTVIVSVLVAIYFFANGYSYILSYLLCWIVLQIAGIIANKLFKLPILKEANRFAGGVLGFVKAMVWVFLFLGVIYLLNESHLLMELQTYIKENTFLLYLYEHNPIFSLGDIFKSL